MNYEHDIEIDDSALDIECLDQPKLMLRYGRNEAQMEKEADQAKEQLDLTRADLDLDIRTNPEKYKIDVKITEAVINNTVMQQPMYKEANEKYLNAKYEHRVARNAVRAFEERKDMLEGLIRLHGQQYFAGPKIPRDLHDEVTKRNKQDRADAVVQRPTRRRRVE